jgi:hypothetical protein
MKRTVLITLVVGALIALLSYAAGETGILGIKAYFKIGFTGLGLMILVEWAKETDFFKKIL